MIKKNLGTLILTTVILLLPMVIGLMMWNKLPDQVPMHWNISGEVDGWGSKGMLVFVFPLLFVGIEWLGFLATAHDFSRKGFSKRPLQLVLWICPCLSLLIHTLIYAKILGYDPAVDIVTPLVMGLGFIVVGNLLPKCKRNRTVGIKLPWTLNNDDNWNKTHRLAGKLWVVGGAIIAATAVLGTLVISFVVLLAMVMIPTVYSYLYFCKQKKEGN